ncbi:MAG: ligase-associated DNA damage response exonuclease [Minwuia sp.]|uniref:ligase-associated DNA damage response exonuclease n=1 Tax=Minwuia sp. TaxID=2493630 RepID=UPI003A879AB1
MTGAEKTWLENRPEGLYCVPGGFHIDPHRPVDRAVLTHGHADHTRPGNDAILATPETLAIAESRYEGRAANRVQALSYGETIRLGEVDLRLVPAGHILGSAQVVMEHRGQRITVSGDYKRRADPTCAPFEVVESDIFITEATFGLPVFRHPPDAEEIGKLLDSMAAFPDRTHLLGVYALGKCQRMILLLRAAGHDETIYLHGALEKLCKLYRRFGVDLGPTAPAAGLPGSALKGKLVMCPPSAIADRWSRKFGDAVTAVASGWMRVRARARQRGAELPLIVSDHADWDELCQTIGDVNAGEIWVTHGREDALVHQARAMGLEAKALHMIGREEEGE